MKPLKIVLLISLTISGYAGAEALHLTSSRNAFVKDHPCPGNNQVTLECKGYHIDYVIPLCAGGPDQPSNMQWMKLHEAKLKLRHDRKKCRGVKEDADKASDKGAEKSAE